MPVVGVIDRELAALPTGSGVLPTPVVVGTPGWRERIGDAQHVILVLGPRGHGGGGPPDGAHLWEQLVRLALAALAGRTVDIVRPDAIGDGEPTAARFPKAAKGQSIDELLPALYGRHDPLTVPPTLLPSEESEALLRERERLLAEIDALTDGVLTAVSVRPPPAHDDLLPSPKPGGGGYGLDVTGDVAGYRLWLESNVDQWRLEGRAIVDRVATGPAISILVPVYRPEADLLERCVESVVAQSYPSWQLCLFDDHSGDPAVMDALKALARRDARIRVGGAPENGGISAATNGAASLATGDFVAFLDQDDELDPDALAWVVGALDAAPETDVVYTDEDKLDDEGERLEPYFKPDWSPELLLSNMYIGHFFVVRRTLFDRVGGLRPAYDGSQDYDLALRVTEQARRVVHVPRLAYRWRKTRGSTASDYRNKPQSDIAARLALGDALARRGVDGSVESGMHEGTFRIRRRLPDRARVAVIIPYRDGAPLLDLCMRTLDATIDHLAHEVLLVDNQSWEPETLALVRQYEASERCRVLTFDHPFNWSAMNNLAARETDADYLLFMNSDIECRQPGWLEAMLEPAQDSEVGAVGARLLYADGRVQHAGVVLGMGGGVAYHPFRLLPGDQPGYFAQPRVMRNWSAVTGACMLVRRAVFEEVGGFDEHLPTAFNDVDYCLRLQRAGYRIVYTPFAELIHHESASRGTSAMEIGESLDMFARYPQEIHNDPFFNPNLDLMNQEYRVSVASQEVDPWMWTEWLTESSSSVSGTT